MQTIKTGVVVALLLAVCYGAFTALNAPDPEVPDSIKEWLAEDGADALEELDLDLDAGELASMEGAVSMSPEEFMQSLESGTAMAPTESNNPMRSEGDSEFPSIPSLRPKDDENPWAGNEAAVELPRTNDQAIIPSLPELPSTTGVDSSPQLPTIGNINDIGQENTPAAQTTMAEPTMPKLPALGGEASSNLQNEFDQMVKDSAKENALAVPSMGQNETPVDADLEAMRERMRDMTSPTGNLVSSRKNATQNNESTPGLTESPEPTAKFSIAREQALALANRGELKEALLLLTPYYGSATVSYQESIDLIDILDALAREVVYSKRHLLASPHIAIATDNVASVAAQYGMNPELLAALNGLGDAKALVPGKELKVLRGPFHARIDLRAKELTLFIGKMYAGRFPFTVGTDPAPRAGAFQVVDRSTERTYYGAGAVVVEEADPRNPYGGYWINLGNDLCIHGSPQMPSPDLKDAGCISLAPRDAQHVFSILTVGSQVKITQ